MATDLLIAAGLAVLGGTTAGFAIISAHAAVRTVRRHPLVEVVVDGD